jgi:hypothetical protein
MAVRSDNHFAPSRPHLGKLEGDRARVDQTAALATIALAEGRREIAAAHFEALASGPPLGRRIGLLGLSAIRLLDRDPYTEDAIFDPTPRAIATTIDVWESLLEAFVQWLRGDAPDSRDLERLCRSSSQGQLVMRTVSVLGARRLANLQARAHDTLIAHPDGLWVQPPGRALIRASREGPTRRMLRLLTRERIRERGSGMSIDAIVAECWPGEIILPPAARNRFHNLVCRLREGGLPIVSASGRYLLDPEIRICTQLAAPPIVFER